METSSLDNSVQTEGKDAISTPNENNNSTKSNFFEDIQKVNNGGNTDLAELLRNRSAKLKPTQKMRLTPDLNSDEKEKT